MRLLAKAETAGLLTVMGVEGTTDETIMTATNVVLLVFGLGTCARGVYALATQDIEEDGESMVGGAAVQHGLILVAIGLAIASHAIFEWRWVNLLVDWLHRLE